MSRQKAERRKLQDGTTAAERRIAEIIEELRAESGKTRKADAGEHIQP